VEGAAVWAIERIRSEVEAAVCSDRLRNITLTKRWYNIYTIVLSHICAIIGSYMASLYLNRKK
jgi:hypothetical protein